MVVKCHTTQINGGKADVWRGQVDAPHSFTKVRPPMSVRLFHKLIKLADFRKTEQEWFPKWIARYSEFVNHDGRSAIPLSREQALAFSRMLLAGGLPA